MDKMSVFIWNESEISVFLKEQHYYINVSVKEINIVIINKLTIYTKIIFINAKRFLKFSYFIYITKRADNVN